MTASFDPRAGLKARMIRWFTSTALAFAALTCVQPARAESQPLTLEDAVGLALKESPQIAATAAVLEAAQAVLPSAGRLPDPELVAAVDNLPVNTSDRYSFTRDFMTMRRIGIMQSFPNGQKRRLQSERAEQGISIAQAGLRKSRFDTALAVSEAWIAQAVAEESRRRLHELKPETELQAAATQAALASGRASASEALAAQSLVVRLNERIRALDQEIETRRSELERWVGDLADRPLAPIPTSVDLDDTPESLLAAVPQHAPLAPIIAELDAAKTDVDLARAEKHPDWSAELGYQQRGSDFSDMISLELRIGLPLFAKHRQNPVIAEKLAMVRAQEAERDAEIRMHTAEVEAALAAWRGGRERLQHYATELLPLARDRTRAAVASYGTGRGDLLGAIDALREEIETQLEFVQLEGDVTGAWAFLHFLHASGASS